MKKLLLLSSIFVIWGCGDGSKEPTIEDLEAMDDTLQTQEETVVQPDVDPEVLNNIFNSIPSPLEMSFLIKNIGSVYDVNYLNTADKLEEYTTSYEKALNLGIYGADLAYTNIYNQNQDGLAYLGSVRGLAKDLSIDQFFDSETLTELIKNSENLDSLLLITTSNFEKINLHLQSQKRAHLSALLLTGGWLEGLNLACNVYNQQPNAELKDKIGEQKTGLEQLLQLLGYYEKDKNIKPLLDDLNRLKEAFAKVKIEIIEAEPELKEIDGIMMIVDNNETKIIYTEEELKEISALTSEIRAGITK